MTAIHPENRRPQGHQPAGRELLALGIVGAAGVAALGAGLLLWKPIMAVATDISRTGGWSEEAGLPPLFPADEPAGPMLDGTSFATGKQLFGATCAACHGPAGHGVQGLGKNLAASRWVRDQSDTALVAFLKQGRTADDPLNTTKVPMPPRGGNPALTDAHLEQLVAFVRGLQDPRRVPTALPEVHVAVAAQAPTGALADLPGIEDSEYEAQSIRDGQRHFMASCVSCHGPDARGIVKLGKDLVASDYVRKQQDEALLAFLKAGRPTSDPLNTTKVDMPPKGGNPALDDQKLGEIIAYLRYLQERESKTKHS
ncbi:MAG: cytochrome c [Phycisphaerales bacterium]